MYYKIAQLIQTPGVKGNTIGDVFVSQQNKDKEDLAGKLFVLAEIESKSIDNLKIINFLIESLVNNYYQNDKLVLRERIKTIKIDYIFESALFKTNKELAAFLEAEKIKLAPELINITVGVIFENNLYFSSLGKNKALLIYKNKERADKPALGRQRREINKTPAVNLKYKIINILDKAKTSDKPSFPSEVPELFTNIITGSLPRGGYILFANETLPEYLSGKQIIEIITTLPPASAVEQIKNILASVNSYISFLGIIIKNTLDQPEKELKKKTALSSAQSSVSNFNTMEEKTEKFLAPRGYINFKKIISLFAKIIPSFKSQKTGALISKTSASGLLKDKIIFKKKSRFSSLLKILNYPKNIFYWLVNFFQYLAEYSTKAKLFEIFNRSKNKIKASFLNFKNLNKKNKTLIAIVLSCFALFAFNLIFSNINNKKAAEENLFNESARIAEQKENQLEAALLYKDEEGARKLAEEIEKLLSALPEKNKTQILKKNNLSARYNILAEKIKHIVKIDGLKELTNFSNLEPAANPNEIILIPEKNKIYSPDNDKKIIYSLDAIKNSATLLGQNLSKEDIISLKNPIVDKNNNIYFINGNKLLFLSAEEKFKNLSLNPAINPADIANSAFYNNSLYLIDKQSGQIYKFKKNGDSFGARTAWLKEKINLSDITSMDIDGSIYILTGNGELSKFTKGKKENFLLNSAIPPLAKTAKLFISKDRDYIYILEGVNKRVVVYSKQGGFLLQYQIDGLNNIKDFAIDEKKKIIYLLNNASIYSGELSHLK
jgi:hypothetical protein